jgi:hypothetical protein
MATENPGKPGSEAMTEEERQDRERLYQENFPGEKKPPADPGMQPGIGDAKSWTR